MRQQQRDWVAILATQFRLAAAAREIAPLNPEEAAFQVAAVLNAVNLALRLGDDDSVSMARHVVNGLLGAGTDSDIPPRTHRAGPRG
ncbi:hypothetical protein [Nocardia sp. GAS34]|uniref:hypothetical protein n=1 Tax=unclassified Nocardia TaxID=2637762 RepID=UPI003D217B60